MLTIDSSKVTFMSGGLCLLFTSFLFHHKYLLNQPIHHLKALPFLYRMVLYRCSWLFFFRSFLWATMVIVEVSYCTPPDKLDLLRSVNNVKPGSSIPHSIALSKLYTRTLHDLRIFLGRDFPPVRNVGGPNKAAFLDYSTLVTLRDRPKNEIVEITFF